MAGGPPMKQTGNSRNRRLVDRRLFTLSEVADSINVSMPTAQKYKRAYQGRIPSVGKGRTQRYPENALKVFEQIKIENHNRRGRPPKSGSVDLLAGLSSTSSTAPRSRRANGRASKSKTSVAQGARRSPAVQKQSTDLLTLTEISERTGISYPTCIKYAKENLGIIPHAGTGRQRRYDPEAVAVFRDLRKRSRRGRRKATDTRPSRTEKAIMERVRKLELSQRQLVRRLDKVLVSLKKPVRVTLSRGQ